MPSCWQKRLFRSSTNSYGNAPIALSMQHMIETELAPYQLFWNTLVAVLSPNAYVRLRKR